MEADVYNTPPTEWYCGDSSCIFNERSGQHTNGGCSCINRFDNKQMFMAIRRLASERKQTQKDNAALLDRFTAPIICLCGSTKFKQTWIAENARLTGQGFIILSVGLWGHHTHIEPTPKQKIFLDELHKRKIDLCDEIYVLDVDGYIGESTRSEIEYAKNHKKPVKYLSHDFPNYQEPEDALLALITKLANALTEVLSIVSPDMFVTEMTQTISRRIDIKDRATALVAEARELTK